MSLAARNNSICPLCEAPIMGINSHLSRGMGIEDATRLASRVIFDGASVLVHEDCTDPIYMDSIQAAEFKPVKV